MENPANTNLPIHPIIKKRWSPRSFKDGKVDTQQLQRLMEAARWSPSSFNEQPWRFIIGSKGDKTWQMLYDIMVEFNQQWTKNASVLILALGNTVSANGMPNTVYQYDVGQAMAYITFQATEDGLATHQIGGFSKEKARDLFNIPEDHEPIAMMALGYQDQPEALPTALAKMEKAPRERKPLTELIFSKEFGQTADGFQG